jgi:hypothetical protein
MNVRLATVALLVGAALLLGGGPALFLSAAPRPRYDDTEYETVSNKLIDCSTNSGYRDRYVKEAFAATAKQGGGAINPNQDCRACHQNDHPVPGKGDKPRASQATALVHNRTSRSVNIEMKQGKNGQWKKATLKPGGVQRITYPYKGKTRRSSPAYYLKYEGDPYNKQRKLTPMATPNKNLGSVYFFDKGSDDKVRFYEPNANVARRNR